METRYNHCRFTDSRRVLSGEALSDLRDKLQTKLDGAHNSIRILGARHPIPGPKGDKGNKGIIGHRGLAGPAGRKGEKGLRGDKGVPGVHIALCAISCDLVQLTFFAGENGPPGVTGPQGEIGVPGPVGPKGEKQVHVVRTEHATQCYV